MSIKQEPLTPSNMPGVTDNLENIDIKMDMSNMDGTVNKTAVNNNNHMNGVNNNLTVNTPLKQCSGCGTHIMDRFLLHAMDRYWHTGCLKCSCCQAPLGEIGTTCFTKAGMILCRNDYIRMFGNTGRCSACGQAIPASEMVMKAQNHVYHVNCFACVTCHSRLVPGDRYSIFNGSLLCEHDFPKAVRAAQNTNHVPLRANGKVR